MSEIIELFKTRLAQLKVVLERDGKIAETLFDKAMQFDKSENLKNEVTDILIKHKFKIKKGYISLPETADRAEIVREFFRETFDTLVKAFGFDITELAPPLKAPEKQASALKLFEMEDELAIETGTQAFESTMQALDTIDTSTPLESIMDGSPPIESNTVELVNPEQIPAEEAQITPVVSTEEIEGQSPPAQAMEQETVSELQVPTPTEIPVPIEQMPSAPEEIVISPPKEQVPSPLEEQVLSPLEEQVPSPPEEQVPSPPAKQVPSPPAKQVPSPPVKHVLTLPAKQVPSPPMKQVLSLPAKQVPSPPVKLVPKPPVKLVPSPPVKQVPVPKVQKPPAAEISYTYYVCNRCGAEISKMDIKQSGSYLECPRCNFTFSRAEASTIQKKPGSQDKATSQYAETRGKGEPAIEETSQGENFDLFSDKGDESLVRPSDLFKDRQDMFIGAPEKEVESKQALQSREKPQKKVPGERLVRPSEYLGQMQENIAPEGNAGEPATSPEVASGESVETRIESSGTPESEVQDDMNTRAAPARKAPMVQAPKPAPQARQVSKGATLVAMKPKQETKEPQFLNDHLVKPSERLVRPSELREIAKEKQAIEEKCPHCGSTKFTKIQDRTKIVSYNPLMYGSRKKCSTCSFIFD